MSLALVTSLYPGHLEDGLKNAKGIGEIFQSPA